jgi:hypothetical protein
VHNICGCCCGRRCGCCCGCCTINRPTHHRNRAAGLSRGAPPGQAGVQVAQPDVAAGSAGVIRLSFILLLAPLSFLLAAPAGTGGGGGGGGGGGFRRCRLRRGVELGQGRTGTRCAGTLIREVGAPGEGGREVSSWRAGTHCGEALASSDGSRLLARSTTAAIISASASASAKEALRALRTCSGGADSSVEGTQSGLVGDKWVEMSSGGSSGRACTHSTAEQSAAKRSTC